MDRGLAVLLTAVAGGLIALQAPINAGLGKATGSLPAALVSFGVGTIALAAIVVLSGKAGGLGSTFDVSWYYLLGGLLGAVYVTNALIAVSRDRRRRGRGGDRHRPAHRLGRDRPARPVRPRPGPAQPRAPARRRPAARRHRSVVR